MVEDMRQVGSKTHIQVTSAKGGVWGCCGEALVGLINCWGVVDCNWQEDEDVDVVEDVCRSLLV